MSLTDTDTGHERASVTAERHCWPATQAAVDHSRRPAPPRPAFWLVAGVLCLLFFGAAAPTPLYGIYRAQLRFSATTLTAEDIEGVMIAIAPVVGTPRVMAAAGHIFRALGFAIAVGDAEMAE